MAFRKEPILAHTWLHACFTERSHSCAARKYRTGRVSFLFHSGIGLSPSCARVKRCATTPRHGMTWRGAHLHDACCLHCHVPWCLGTTRAVMSWSLILDIVPPIYVRSRYTTLRPALILYIANSSRLLRFKPPPAGTQTSLTSRDCDVMTTSIVAPNQNVARA